MRSSTQRTLGFIVAGLMVIAAACSSGDGSVVTVDGVAIDQAAFEALHTTPDTLDVDATVGSVLLLILQQSFADRAEADFAITASESAVEEAYEALAEPLRAKGELPEVLAARNETEARLRINAELDVLSDSIGEHLVRTESGGFDLELAEQDYLLVNGEVCVRQIQLSDALAVDQALGRLAAGDPFEDVARELSTDPFVEREEGVGAGGDLGCSAPSALPEGLDVAVLDVPINETSGPIGSSLGVHIIEVYERTLPDLDAEHDEVLSAAVPVQGPDLFREWAVTVLLDIEVEVDDEYGRWGILPETKPVPTVVPPYRYDEIAE